MPNEVRSERKLPRWLRKGNVIYQVFLSTLAAVNTGLTLIDSQYADIPPMYFKVCAIGLSALPVIWSKFLDEMKKYNNERTPTPSIHEMESQNESPPATPPESPHDSEDTQV